MECVYASFGEWELSQKLGSGAFGEVFLWTHRKTKFQIATKSLKENKTLGLDEEYKLKERWQQEYEISRKLNTDFIVRGVELDDKNFLNYLNDNHVMHPLPVMVMEFCNGGDLRAHLQRLENLNGLTEFEVRNVLRTLRGAVEYMHTNCNIKHRDLKPDNIVIHKKPNGDRIYKLTDFGFARYINDKTMLQSVVGTRNYFAPEVIDTSEYTKTVDYWSIGIIGFEMLCGCLPFIPHQSIYHFINSIKSKPATCIAITEDFNEPKKFENHDTIFDENRVSKVFRMKIEPWLRLALDNNFRTRGTSLAGPLEIPNATGGRVKKFYTALDEVLNTRVLTIFNLSSNIFHDFEINQDTKIQALKDELSKATEIPIRQLFSVLPVGHPLKNIYSIKQAMDLYVEQWQDKNDTSNPPVMLYLVDIDFKGYASEIPDPKISPLIIHCMRIAEKELPLWLFQKFAFDIHYLLANEQYHLSTMLHGLHEYAMNIEHEILNSKVTIEKVMHDANVICGRVLQYESMICEAKKRLKLAATSIALNFFTEWDESIKKLQDRNVAASIKIIPSLLARSNSAFRRMKEESNSPFYNELIKKDVYELKPFRQHLQANHQGYRFETLIKTVHGCKYCYKAVYEFIEQRCEILKTNRKKLRQISEIHKEHRLIMETTENTKKLLGQMDEKIKIQTRLFYKEFFDTLLPNVERSVSLVVDGVKNSDSSSSWNETSLSNLCTSITEIMDISTRDLIREAEDNIELMSIDCDNNQNNIPETVNFN